MKKTERICTDGSANMPSPAPETGHHHNTASLLHELKEEKDIESFIRRNGQAFYCESISGYMEVLLKKYGVSKNEAIRRADIDRSYGYQILRGIRSAARDKYIRLAFGMGLDLEDTQRMLMIAKQGALYPKVMRDALLIYCINNKYDILTVQSQLFGHNLDILE